ncbi:MAG: c-type cytochrome, partial [Rhodoferax sp.]|nr:c-type cytochrome [Rhodoferax sp.]
FHDPRLSRDDTISCASCHSLNTGGVDNRARSIGVAGGVSSVNAPSVFNSGLNFVQFWDGRSPTLEAQIEGPVNHPLEMASNWLLINQKLAADAHYPELFTALYADGISVVNIKDALATFERSLITPNSRFDKFLNGDTAALNDKEKQGYELFQSYGCASCHQGQNLGGNMFEKMGLMGDYFAERGNLTEADKGRFNVTQDADNLYEFRVPSLRNVALTAPYFHDGYAATLEQAVAIMAKYQLGRPMPEEHLNAITAFLRSLT